MKIYKSPSCELCKLMPTDLLLASGDRPTTLTLGGEYVDDGNGMLSVNW